MKPQLAGHRYYRKAAAGPQGAPRSGAPTDRTPAPVPAAGAPSSPQIEQALARSGMAQGGTFQPGRPQSPYWKPGSPARAMDYPITVNTNIQGRAAWGRVSFDTIKAIVDAYDVARMCTNHKIDEIRSMEPMFLPKQGVNDDVDDEIEAARLVLAKPDRELPYESWVSKWLENAVKYDNAPLYKRRDFNDDIIGLEVLDGKTVHPYIDENGRRPVDDAPAYQQIIHGMVGNWFFDRDIIYVPFRPQEDSPYGMAPMESLLLTANTDLRFQWHFLQMFTDGSIPGGFMELPPDVSSPDQVAEWQDYWDAMILGDQAKIGQLIAVPNGTKFTATKPATFDKTFPQYLMMRTCAGHGVVPQDLGLIEDVNRANGETQVDVQFRVNTLPWVLWVQGILTRYLQDDIGLRVQVKLDTGRDKEDRYAEAQAHQLYVEMGAESPDEVRSEVLGLPIDEARPTPRFVLVQRVGPIPLLALEGVAGKTDPETHGPAADQPVLDQPYVPPVGVVATPGTTDDQASLQSADQYQQYVRRTLENEGAPNRESREQKQQRGAKAEQDQADTRGEAAEDKAATAPDDEQAPAQPPARPVAKQELDGREAAELTAFREFVRGSVRKGRWDRDFSFFTVPGHLAIELNRGGRAEVAAGRVEKSAAKVPGLTKRSGMISLDLDPGTVPAVPGQPADHHVTVVYLGKDVDDEAFERACRRAQAAASAEDGPAEGDVHGLGVFPPSESSDGKLPVFAEVNVPAAQRLYTRLKDLSASGRQAYHPHVTRAYVDPGDPMPEPVAHTPVRFTHLSVHRGEKVVRYPLGGPQAVTAAEVAKANFTDPKAPAGQSPDWPGWALDQAAAAYWAPRIASALIGALDVQVLVQEFEGSRNRKDRAQHESAAAMALIARAWLAHYLAGLTAALRPVLEDVYTDGYLIGAASAQAVLAGRASGQELAAEVAHWSPGDMEAARLLLGQSGDGSGLRALLAESEVTIKSIAETRLDDLGTVLGDGVAAGLDPTVIAGQIEHLLTNTSRALMIATTEISRASAKAAEDRYKKAGYLATEWLVEDGDACPICKANQEQGPVRIGHAFLSGDLRPPGHPWCRCASVPAHTEM